MQRLRIVVHLVTEENGSLRASVDSPDQGATGLPVDSAVFEESTLRLSLPQLRATYEGRLNDKGDELVGTWKQGGISLELRLEAVEAASAPRRPQQPQPPYPYITEDVSFPSQASGVTLAGTFTCPTGPGPFPGVALLSGSGPSDRDETVFGHKPFLVLADHLSRNGIAVLRFDDRGVGGSSGGTAADTTNDVATDALGAVAWLSSNPKVNARGVGLIGHSEGGLAALLAADGSRDVSFVVLLAGPGLPGDHLLELQIAAVAAAGGMGKEQVAALVSLNRQAYEIVNQEPDDEAAAARLHPLFEEAGLSPEARGQQIKVLVSPWFRYFLTHDPSEDLARLKIPLLALFGAKDTQIVAAPHRDAMKAALDGAGHEDHTLTVLPGLNHLFQECETGAVGEYGAIEQTIAPQVLGAVTEWIRDHVAGDSAKTH